MYEQISIWEHTKTEPELGAWIENAGQVIPWIMLPGYVGKKVAVYYDYIDCFKVVEMIRIIPEEVNGYALIEWKDGPGAKGKSRLNQIHELFKRS